MRRENDGGSGREREGWGWGRGKRNVEILTSEFIAKGEDD